GSGGARATSGSSATSSAAWAGYAATQRSIDSPRARRRRHSSSTSAIDSLGRRSAGFIPSYPGRIQEAPQGPERPVLELVDRARAFPEDRRDARVVVAQGELHHDHFPLLPRQLSQGLAVRPLQLPPERPIFRRRRLITDLDLRIERLGRAPVLAPQVIRQLVPRDLEEPAQKAGRIRRPQAADVLQRAEEDLLGNVLGLRHAIELRRYVTVDLGKRKLIQAVPGHRIELLRAPQQVGELVLGYLPRRVPRDVQGHEPLQPDLSGRSPHYARLRSLAPAVTGGYVHNR